VIEFSCERVIKEVRYNVMFCAPLLIIENNFTIQNKINRFQTHLE